MFYCRDVIKVRQNPPPPQKKKKKKWGALELHSVEMGGVADGRTVGHQSVVKC